MITRSKMDVTESITVLESDARQIFRDIRKLKDMFKVRIWVRKDETNPGYSVVESTGNEVNTKQAIDYINANLPRTLSMHIHPDDIGWIIGKSGDNIRSLKSLYHINAWFKQNTLHLRGRPADIEKAKESINCLSIKIKEEIRQAQKKMNPTIKERKNILNFKKMLE
uniref:K Homology domain-containing protein n=1 Tax=Acrobeloides nanus TaxID=290746 RepID=A0A914C1W5_9BILA